MAKFTIEQLKEDLEHWEWFPLEFVLGDGYAMQFMFMEYDEEGGLFLYKHGFTRKYLMLSIDNIENDSYTVIKAWLAGCELFTWNKKVKKEHKEDYSLYEVPVWMAMQEVLSDVEKTYGSHPGIPWNEEVSDKIHKALKEQGYNIKTVTPEDMEKIKSGEMEADDLLGDFKKCDDDNYICPDCGENCRKLSEETEESNDEEESGKVGGKYLN